MKKAIVKLTTHIKALVERKHVELRSKSHLTEAYSLGILPPTAACKTGCWTYNAATKKHEIKLSPLAYDTIATPSLGAGVRKAVPKLFSEVYEHEAAHSVYTTKDLKGLNDELKKHKIPWRLMNLFEDIRIETLWARFRRRSFCWTTWEKLPEDISTVTPTALLYHMKNDSSLTRRLSRKFYSHFGALPFFDTVARFFHRIRACRSTEKLIPILIDWLRQFPKTSDDSIEGAGGLGTGDLKDAIEGSVGETVTHVPKSPDGEGEPTTREEAKQEREKAERELEGVPVSDRLPDITTSEAAHELKLASKLAGMLDTAFRGEGVARSTPTVRPSSKLNVRAILRKCFDLPYIGKAVTRNGVPHISVLFDGSGSMAAVDCYIDRERTTKTRVDAAGRILMLALSILAKKGRLKADVYLCAGGGVYSRVSLPFKSYSQAKEFRGFSGHEGFGVALDPTRRGSRACFAEVSKTRLVLAYTDGVITDEPINKTALRAKGVNTIGLCCSAHDYTEFLKDNFDYPLCRESLWGLADSLVRLLRSIKA